jgi:hypothetical protein
VLLPTWVITFISSGLGFSCCFPEKCKN